MIDFESRKEGRENYTSAQDIASMLDKIYAGKLINRDYSEKALCFLARQKICDRLPKRLPAGTIVAHKTGLERNVCHDAGIVFSPYGDYLICVLTRHHSKTARLAKAFIAKVSLEVYNFYRDNQ